MLYVTGDLHADLCRLKGRESKALKKGDTLLVCGDFGFVWDGSRKEKRILSWIARRPYQVLFIEGTHDNMDLLRQYPETGFCGGRARQLGKNLYYLCRGEIFTLEGKRVFALGGGESDDMDIRIPGISWWEEELPGPQEIEHARETLRQAANQVDYIITHECSVTLKGFLHMEDTRITQLNAFFEEITNTCSFKRWAFGCYHLDKRIPASYLAVYKNIVPLE